MRKKVLIVSATYYVDFSKQLEMWAIKHLDNERIKNKIIQVPGVFEIPVIISKNIKKYDGFIALGCVIKGETPHFDFISQATTSAIMKLSIDHYKPVGNGIITCLTKEQANKRSMKKGGEAAKAVISILSQ